MSLADDKRSVFTTIGSYNSLIQEGDPPAQTDLYPSINSKNDTVGFLLDVLKTVAGTEALKLLIGGMFTGLVKKIEPELKTALKKQFTQSNASEPLPASFKSNGVTTSVKSIDVNNKLKVDPNSANGSLIYGDPSDSFDGLAYNAIQNSGNFENYNNMSIKYIEGSDTFQIKPNLGGTNPTIGEYFNSFIDDTELLNEKEITSSVMDSIYGTLASSQEKTSEQVYQELRIQKQLKQILDGDDSFVILPEDNNDLLTRADELAAGVVNYDMGCGLMPAELSFDDFNELIQNISGSTDQYYVGDQMEATIDQSSETPEMTTENKQTMKDGFFQEVINSFTLKITEAVTTAPQVNAMFAMIGSLQNQGDTLSDDGEDTLKKFEICIKCMAKKIMALVAAFIFALAISYLIKLLKPVIKKVIKEKINQFVGLIKSLTGANKFI